MQRTAISITMILALLSGSGLFGCSGSDVLDERSDTWVLTEYTIEDCTGEGNDIDVFSWPDCDGDPATEDPEDSLCGVTGAITIKSASTAPFIRLESYRVDYIPKSSPLWSGGTALPPALDAPERVEQTVDIPTNSTVTIPIPNIMTIDTKLNYWFQDGGDTFAHGLYVIRITFYGIDENDQDVKLQYDTVVRLMDVDTCP